jgi:hypothetical protein
MFKPQAKMLRPLAKIHKKFMTWSQNVQQNFHIIVFSFGKGFFFFSFVLGNMEPFFWEEGAGGYGIQKEPYQIWPWD